MTRAVLPQAPIGCDRLHLQSAPAGCLDACAGGDNTLTKQQQLNATVSTAVATPSSPEYPTQPPTTTVAVSDSVPLSGTTFSVAATTTVPVSTTATKRKVSDATSTTPCNPCPKRPALASMVGRPCPAQVERELTYDAACRIINTIWPNHSSSVRTQLCSLRHFVKETHSRSRLPTQVLKLAIFLLFRVKHALQRKRQEQWRQHHQQPHPTATHPLPATGAVGSSTAPMAPSSHGPTATATHPTLSTPPASPEAPAVGCGKAATATPPGLPNPALLLTPAATPNATTITPTDVKLTESEQASFATAAVRALAPEKTAAALSAHASFNGQSLSPTNAANPQVRPTSSGRGDPTRCGRRMYLAALMAASKFYVDKTYSNKAWIKISTLKTAEVNHLEIAFMHLINFDIYIDPDIFDKWNRLFALHLRLSMVADPILAHQKALINAALFSFAMMDRTHLENLQQYQRQQQLLATQPPASMAAPTSPHLDPRLSQLTLAMLGHYFSQYSAPLAASSAASPAPLDECAGHPAKTAAVAHSLCRYFHDYVQCVGSLVMMGSATMPPAGIVAASRHAAPTPGHLGHAYTTTAQPLPHGMRELADVASLPPQGLMDRHLAVPPSSLALPSVRVCQRPSNC
ncbi:PHO85 cyclin-5 [Dimargaris verticillata]|uniref:PHO85 cyclin-5 n=1 Tax=Dimargaris verticillata TaxID=2761393 RepID=A0A9W8AX19_9FUNG|nr:PHO85 cyclin-5 [Dimargaris verticillata]